MTMDHLNFTKAWEVISTFVISTKMIWAKKLRITSLVVYTKGKPIC